MRARSGVYAQTSPSVEASQVRSLSWLLTKYEKFVSESLLIISCLPGIERNDRFYNIVEKYWHGDFTANVRSEG